MGECHTCELNGEFKWGRFQCTICADNGSFSDYCLEHTKTHKHQDNWFDKQTMHWVKTIE